MAIHNEEIMEMSEGIEKTLEKSALKIIFDNSQKHQYQYVEASTIRELFSNAYDSIQEKLVALSILRGQSQPSDHFLERHEEVYRDSNFFKDYYDEKWLDFEDNNIYIDYYCKPGNERDVITIRDYGVGIGDLKNPATNQSRLEGYLKLGYSTKRNTNSQLGKWGMGAKAALSTGIDKFTMTTNYNGKRFQIDVYDYNAQSTMSKWSDNYEPNPSFVLGSDGNRLEGYYQNVEDFNGTTISLEVKKYNKQAYINAVKSQLMYFKNVKFVIHESIEDGSADEFESDEEEIDVSAKILYEDEYIIIPKDTYYAKPHFVINRMNYGFINYAQLETEEKTGCIGFKVNPDSVSVTPSRESVIWDEKTRKTTIALQDKITEIAQKVIEQELDSETDFLTWIRKCISIKSSNSTSVKSTDSDKVELIKRLLSMVTDKWSVPLAYGKDKTVKYDSDVSNLFGNFKVEKLTLKEVRKGKLKVEESIARDNQRRLFDLSGRVYIQKGGTSNRIDTYLLREYNSVIKIIIPKNLSTYEQKIEAFLMASPNTFIYEDVEVPLYINEIVNGVKTKRIYKEGEYSLEQMRKMNEATVLFTPYPSSTARGNVIKWHKEEPKIFDVLHDGAEVVYGFEEDKELLAALATMFFTGYDTIIYNNNFKIVKIAKPNAQYYTNHIYVKEFILNIDYKEKSIGINERVGKWAAARIISTYDSKFAFLRSFKPFNRDIYELWHELELYKQENYRPIYNTLGVSVFPNYNVISEIYRFADNVAQYQRFIGSVSGYDSKKELCKLLFDTPYTEEPFEYAFGADLEIMDKLNKLLEYVQPIATMMNNIPIGNYTDAHYEIAVYLQAKNRSLTI